MAIGERIEIRKGDITEADTDAIVNAANNELQLGGGLAGAIRRKAGPCIQAECDKIGAIPVGGAASSPAHALRIAAQKGLRSIAFPAIGTGIGGFPLRECAEIMLREAARHFENPTPIERVSFVLFDQEALAAFEGAFRDLQE